MTEEKVKKHVFLCRVITVISSVIMLVLMTFVYSSYVYMDNDLGDGFLVFLKYATYILSAGIFVPPFVIIYLKYTFKEKDIEKRMKELEKEIELLKKSK